MFKLLVVALLVGIASGSPVISLSLDESSLTKNTVYKGQYGVGCNKNAALCRKQQGENRPAYPHHRRWPSRKVSRQTQTRWPAKAENATGRVIPRVLVVGAYSKLESELY